MILSDQQRDIVRRLVAGETAKKIAFDLSVAYGSVRWELCRARQQNGFSSNYQMFYKIGLLASGEGATK